MAFAVFAVSGFIGIGAFRIAEIVAVGVSPKGGVDNFDIVFGNEFRVVVVLFVETLFKSIVHGVDGGLAVVVATHSVEVGFLDEEKKKK